MKIALTNQRYGLEINGGSELHTRQVAERLTKWYDVDVITTCALDYVTWQNHYPPGVEILNGVTVHRFPINKKRSKMRFDEISEIVLGSARGAGSCAADEELWIDEQGPYCPAAIEYIEQHAGEYDAIIFVTYLYWITVRGIEKVKDKAILIPTAHDEPPIYLKVYERVFNSPRAIAFNTEEERNFIYKMFHNEKITQDLLGVGIDVPQNVNAEAFTAKYDLKDDYLVYVGRIDESKGCGELFDYFLRYKQKRLKLVLIGKPVMKISKSKDIISLGFVSDEDKFNGIAGAKALVLPSKYESLSMSTLEAMALGVPVVVNGDCEVLKGHCKKSNAGLYYRSYEEFEGCLNYLITHDEEYNQMGINGKRYVADNYDWSVIMRKLKSIIDGVIQHNATL